ncbi:MAG: D-alanyl-D-alanine carboxypeptidase [Clostridia bacterium]|nr:D-alanyl-D-alanine carboxypeptidase [Clostridia bacterium]
MKTIKRVILCFVCTFMIHSTLFTFNVLKAKESVKHDSYTAMMKSDEVDLYSQNAILINLNDDRILYEKQIKEKIYPASMTKIMTTLVAIEKIDDLDARVSITQDMLAGLREANASVAGFRVGESVSYRDLLYGILLPSGADASRAIAFSIFQDEEHFVQAMNEKAKAIKMKDTHFVNVSGLHDDEHYSSVYDISILLREALQNELFKTIFCTPSYQCENGLTLYSTLQRQAYNAHLDVSFIAGAKTGFTNEASLCLASYTKMNDEEYKLNGQQVRVTMPAPDMSLYNQLVIVHYLEDGSVEYITPIDNKDGTISFVTTSFSPYNIAGSKVLIGNTDKLYSGSAGALIGSSSGSNRVSQSSSGSSSVRYTSASGSTSTNRVPLTGDDQQPLMYFVMSLAALAVIAVLSIKAIWSVNAARRKR